MKLLETCSEKQKDYCLQRKEQRQELLDFLAIFQKQKELEKGIKQKEQKKEQITDLL